MSCHDYVVIDHHEDRLGEVYRALASSRLVIPIHDVSELGSTWPEHFRFLIADSSNAIARAVEATAEKGKHHPVIAYGDVVDPQRIVSAVMAGAVHYVQWPCDVAEIENIDDNSLAVSRSRIEALAGAKLAKRMLHRLSDREIEVMRCVCTGLSNKHIAQLLKISPRTVEIHRANALAKLGAKNSVDATRIFLQGEGMEILRKAAA